MEQPTAAQILLWITAGGMVFGAVAFLWLATRVRRPDTLHHYGVAIAIVGWAALNYAVMASGAGIVEVTEVDGGTRLFYGARYVDWLLTTPLLLISLVLIGLGSLRRNLELVGALVLADVLMIVFGYLAGVNDGVGQVVWFLLSTLAFLAVLFLIWVPLRAAVQRSNQPESGSFQPLAIMLTVLWAAYPLVWLLGTEGFGALSTSWEVFVFAVLDIAAKVAFGFVLLTGVRQAYGERGVAFSR